MMSESSSGDFKPDLNLGEFRLPSILYADRMLAKQRLEEEYRIPWDDLPNEPVFQYVLVQALINGNGSLAILDLLSVLRDNPDQSVPTQSEVIGMDTDENSPGDRQEQ